MRFNTVAAAFVSLLLDFTVAVPWPEAVQTPVGLMAAGGFSPLPTGAPGLDLTIPKELARKSNSVLYPPPNNWCGFVGGNPDDVLSCAATRNCVYSGTVLGCCGAGLIQTCTNLFTTCANYGDSCNAACQSNYHILKCSNAAIPYCGTFAFDGGTRLYNCDSTRAAAARSVEFLADYYLTAMGSQVLSSSIGPIIITGSSQSVGGGVTTTNSASTTAAGGTAIDVQTIAASSSSTPRPNGGTSDSSGGDGGGGLSTGAIVGIAVGIVVVILALIGGLIAWCCVRRRRGGAGRPNEMQTTTTNPPPPMQQQQQQQPAYVPVPQQAQSQQQPTYPPTQANYFTPAAAKPTFNEHTSALPVPVPEANSHDLKPSPVVGALAEQQGGIPPRYSAVSPPPQSPALGPGAASDYYNNKPPVSPTVTEVEGSSSHTPTPLAMTPGAGGMGYGQGQGQGQGYGMPHGAGQQQQQQQGAYEVDGWSRPGPGAVHEMPGGTRR